MSTVSTTNTSESNQFISQQAAPKKVLKEAYEKVINALRNNEKLILITGSTSKGKTALLHTICKDLSTEFRLISFTGKDIPTARKDGFTEINSILDCVLESTDLNEKIVVTLDDAQLFPVLFLSKLLAHKNNIANKSALLQILLTGPETFKDQLLSIDAVDKNDLIHCKIDTVSDKDISAYAKNKDYKISSNIKNLKFTPEALQNISTFVNSDNYVLDVILEWCAALVKKDQLSNVNIETVTRAIVFAKQFAKDRQLQITNAYPPSHEVYKYINTLQKTDAKNQQTTNITIVESPIGKKTGPSKIPAINHEQKLTHKKEKDKNQIEDNLQITRIPREENNSTSKNSFTPLVAMITLALISVFIFIVQRSNTEITPAVEVAEKISTESSNLNLADSKIKTEMHTTEKEHLYTNQKDSDHPQSEIKTPYVAPLILGEVSGPGLDNIETEQTHTRTSDSDEINVLLALAKKQLDQKQLTTPKGANAFETYQKVLSINPNNKNAIDGIKNVHGKYMGWAAHYHKRNDIERAKRFYNKALIIDPNNNIARAMLNQINNNENPNTSISSLNNGEMAPSEIQRLLISADQKLLQIEDDANANKRNYKLFQEAQVAYETVLRYAPDNDHAKENLFTLANHYAVWADQQAEVQNYNIAIFLYGQALNLQPTNTQVKKRIDEIHILKDAL